MITQETTFWTRTKNEDSEIHQESIIGKYLFFSDDKNLLKKTGEEILLEHKLPSMKISADKNVSAAVGFGYVLCVYSNDSKLRNELKSKECPGLNYRYFKSDDATRSGSYSSAYKKTQ